MSAYSVSVIGGGSVVRLSITPVTYEIRVPQIIFTYANVGSSGSAAVSATVQYYSGGATGGSAATIAPMRAGSPAATATAKSAYTGGSGTLYTIENFATAGSSSVDGLGNFPSTLLYGTFQFQPPYDFILTPGSGLACTLSISTGTNQGTSSVAAFFEELLLSWHQ